MKKFKSAKYTVGDFVVTFDGRYGFITKIEFNGLSDNLNDDIIPIYNLSYGDKDMRLSNHTSITEDDIFCLMKELL